MTEHGHGLLVSRDAQPVHVTNSEGGSLFLLLGDHAGNGVPDQLHQLGLPPAELDRHIGWDIGVAGLGVRMAAQLDAPFVAQRYSRLVIDCNRNPEDPDSIAPISDATAIPGNADITPEQRDARHSAIFAPYHAAIAAMLAERDAAGLRTFLISLHSFTPQLAGVPRPWEIGVLHDGGDARYAGSILQVLERRPDIVVGDNEPYRMDSTDYTVPRHAYAALRPYVEIEVRQDLMADAAGIDRIASILSEVLTEAMDHYEQAATKP